MPQEKSWWIAAARVIGAASCLLLGSCLVTPGKFTSSMTINADRTFVFAYKGEVISMDLTGELDGLGKTRSGDGDGADEDEAASSSVTAYAPLRMGRGAGFGPQGAYAADSSRADKGASDAKKIGSPDLGDDGSSDAPQADDSRASAKREARNRAMAEALMKQEGFRSVVYRGNNVFDIDYEIRGRLDYSFVFPYDIDANIITPFLAIEVRKDGLVRMRADGFSGNNSDKLPGGRKASAGDRLDGVFTLTTNAPIVSQNNEDGVRQVGGNSVMSWRITPLRAASPTVVLKLAPKPVPLSPAAPRP